MVSHGANITWKITFSYFLVTCSYLRAASSFATNTPVCIKSALRNRSAFRSSLKCNSVVDSNTDRRAAFSKISLSFLSGIGVLLRPDNPAFAKEETTAESMAAAFAAVRFELEDPDGGIPQLGRGIEKKDWDNIKEFTKYYDLEFRKAKMVKARKMFPDKQMKGETLQLCNNVTFDLIGINRAARVEDAASASKYYEELKKDVSDFLAYESKVVIR